MRPAPQSPALQKKAKKREKKENRQGRKRKKSLKMAGREAPGKKHAFPRSTDTEEATGKNISTARRAGGGKKTKFFSTSTFFSFCFLQSCLRAECRPHRHHHTCSAAFCEDDEPRLRTRSMEHGEIVEYIVKDIIVTVQDRQLVFGGALRLRGTHSHLSTLNCGR